MSKPFLIVNVVEGKLGQIWQRDTFDEAVEKATDVAAEQCDSSREEIQSEIETDGDFETVAGDIRVHIAQAEDD